jgi:coniferyl-aldehyde dehydrogenase
LNTASATINTHTTLKEQLNCLQKDFTQLRQFYKNETYPSEQKRRLLLNSLKKSLLENEQAIYNALKIDYGHRSEFDTLIGELIPSIANINYTLKKLKRWMKSSKRHAGLLLFPSSVHVHIQPLGVIGVIVPWNYPVFLSLAPVITALAAGNKVMVKISEYTPATNKVIKQLLTCIADDVVIVEGESEISAAFSALPFDHLLFTGSTQVGKHVARAAANNLTPITLELGGKSPLIIDASANLKIAVDAVILGKVMNAGQICIAPDYILLPVGLQQDFIDLFKTRFLEYYKTSADGVNFANSLTQIIDDKHALRLSAYIEDAIDKGAVVHTIQEAAVASPFKLQQPLLITNVNDSMEVMKNEIFGPLLPIITYDNIDEAIAFVNAKPRPLALYVMSSDADNINKVLVQTHSGGVCVNDTLMHIVAEDAPFGGIGQSGMGHYHGEEGFRTFSKEKTVLVSSSYLPKNKIMLKYRDRITPLLRTIFLR